ncbi:MAG: GTP pyrophosphokinase family protein [Lachnospiraceae bacterium]
MKELSCKVVPDVPIGFPISYQEVKEMYMLYTCAMREMSAKLENLSQEFELGKERNPIQHLRHRIKTPESIRNKMLRLELPLEYDVMRDNIFDIAGVRVICSYIDDIYEIADMLSQQDDITVIRRKDYIASPKPNGYRSYHLIVQIPVYLSKEKQMIPVEIQMRTLAMDFWASLEHPLRYKSEINVPDSIRQKLTNLAGDMFKADTEMQQIHQEMLQSSLVPLA